MRVSFRRRAGENERYALDAFADQIGARVPLNVGGLTFAECEIVDAVVSGDRAEVELTYDMPDEAAAAAGLVPSIRSGPGVGFVTLSQSAEVSPNGYTITTGWAEYPE